MGVKTSGYMPRVTPTPFGEYPYGAQKLEGMEGAYQIFDYTRSPAMWTPPPGKGGCYDEPVVQKKKSGGPVAASSMINATYQYPERKVLVLNFDPAFDTVHGSKRQHELMPGWSDPKQLSTDFINDMREVSHGNLNYTVAQWIDVDEMPQTESGASYTLEYYHDTLKKAIDETNGAYWTYEGWENLGGDVYNFGYMNYINRYEIDKRVDRGEIDEVWVFAGPESGVIGSDSRMAGRKAIDAGAPPLGIGGRPFFIHFFNFENDVAEMLEIAGHRAEVIYDKVFGYDEKKVNPEKMNDWEKFRLDDEKAPDNSGVGSMHRAPNSQSDYDWGNTRYIVSHCQDWDNYPNMTGARASVNSSAWGRGDERAHHKWWLSMLPHDPSQNEATGKINNWWLYYIDPSQTSLAASSVHKEAAATAKPAKRGSGMPKLTVPTNNGAVRLQRAIYF